MSNYVKLIDSVYDSIFKKKINNHSVLALRNFSHKKKYSQPILASKDLSTRNLRLKASWYQLNKDFQLAVPHSLFLSQQELKKAFKDFCIKSLSDVSSSILLGDKTPSTLLSTLHHDNAGKCNQCGNAVDKKYLIILRTSPFQNTERVCLFCLDDLGRCYYKCDKCGILSDIVCSHSYKIPKFYPRISVALSDNEKETYNGVSVSLLQKLNIPYIIETYRSGTKYITLCPTQQQLDIPKIASFIDDKRLLSAIKKNWGRTLCDKCSRICRFFGHNLMVIGISNNSIVEDNLEISYPLEYIDYIDIGSIQREISDSLIAEIESNPELIYQLLLQPKNDFSAKEILKIISDAIINKFSTNKNSDSIINEIIASRKKAEAIVIIPSELLITNNTKKIQDTLDILISHIHRKVDYNINSEVSLEDEALTVTLDISK